MDRRKKRTSTNQYMMYINMMEKDPIFASGKVPRDVDLNYLTKKWKELSDKLNACGSGPTLTAEEWRKRLNDWKNTTRCKYRRSISGEKDVNMTQLELKALDLFGKVPNITAPDSISLHLKSEKDDDQDDDLEHNRTSESFQKELQAAVEEAIGGDDDDEDDENAMLEEHVEQDEELLEETMQNASSSGNTVTIDNGTNANDSVIGGGSTSTYRTIVVDNTAYVEEDQNDDHLEYISQPVQPPTTRRTTLNNVQNTNVQTVMTTNPTTTSTTTKLINGGIPLKRLRTQRNEQIIYEVKNTHIPQTHAPRTYTTLPATNAAPITIHHQSSNKATLPEPTSHCIDSQQAREIAHQLKRLADVKHEKLKFEIARFKFNNPGFHYSHPQL